MSSRRGAPFRFQDKTSKHRGRNVIELCKCSKCKAGALPGDEGCYIARWEVEKHRFNDQLRNMPMYQRGKPHTGMVPSQRASGSARAFPRRTQDDDCEARGERPSKRPRLTDDDGEARGEGLSKCTQLTQDDEELELEYLDPLVELEQANPLQGDPVAPNVGAAPDGLQGLYEDPDDADDELLQALLEAEGPQPQPHVEPRDIEPWDIEPQDIEPRDINEPRDVDKLWDIDQASDATDETLDRGRMLRNAIRSARPDGANADSFEAPTGSIFTLPLPSALRPQHAVAVACCHLAHNGSVTAWIYAPTCTISTWMRC